MKKISLTIEELRFIWSLGFTSGRVEAISHPRAEYGWNDETPLWQSDLKRVEFANKPLFQSIKSAQPSAQATAATPSKTGKKTTGKVARKSRRA